MRAWHPKSWSQQAREMSDRIIHNVNSGGWCFAQAERFLRKSYRPQLILLRAAKRYGRAVRAGKVHELYAAVEAWEQRKEKYYIE